MESTNADILLVEDNPADIDLTRESLDEARIQCDLDVVKDGVAAMNYLQGEGDFEEPSQPDLMLLDLNMPKKDGREVLEECKEDDRLCKIPIVVMTSSEAETDIAKAYQMKANAYVVKPVDLDKFVELMRKIGDFWLRVVKLPTDRGG
jgi:CheY-like chemotaxis protein